MFKKFSFLLLLATVMHLAGAEPEKSVVQIITFMQQPIWDAPWRFDSVRKGTGSGFVVKGKKIMTNAHVISWGRQILVRRFQDPKPYIAHVAFVGHDCDLALLEVEDEKFFDGLEPLPIGELPPVRSAVVTYGYPAGGEQISYTRGVVSRIEIANYVHIGNRASLVVQTDAAINPGNSGGPVIQEDKVVGVAFQGISGLENTGFFIPPTVIEHFLKDIEDGTYHGIPQAGIRMTSLHNPAYRKYLKLKEDYLGVRVDSILPIAETRKVVQPDDVILKVGPFDVGSDGTVLFKGNRVQAAVAFQSAQHGESVPVELQRNGERLQVSLPVFAYDRDKNAGNQYDVLPRYFVYGGLVFTPLSLDYIKSQGRNGSEGANEQMVYELFYHIQENPDTVRKEPIVLANVLADEVNANFQVVGRTLVDKINGVRIEKLEDVIAAFGKSSGGQHLIEFLPDTAFECLDKTAADAANSRILQEYGIAKDRRL